MGNAQWWVCDECKSANDLSAGKCYNCRAKKPANPQVIGDAHDDAVSGSQRVGITVDLESVQHLMQPDPIAESKEATEFAPDFQVAAAGATAGGPGGLSGSPDSMATADLSPMRAPVQRSISVLGKRPVLDADEADATSSAAPSGQPVRPADPGPSGGAQQAVPTPPGAMPAADALPPDRPVPRTARAPRGWARQSVSPPPNAVPPTVYLPTPPEGSSPPLDQQPAEAVLPQDQRPPAPPGPPPVYAPPGPPPTYGVPPVAPPPPGQMMPPAYPPPPPGYAPQEGGPPPGAPPPAAQGTPAPPEMPLGPPPPPGMPGPGQAPPGVYASPPGPPSAGAPTPVLASSTPDPAEQDHADHADRGDVADTDAADDGD